LSHAIPAGSSPSTTLTQANDALRAAEDRLAQLQDSLRSLRDSIASTRQSIADSRRLLSRADGRVKASRDLLSGPIPRNPTAPALIVRLRILSDE